MVYVDSWDEFAERAVLLFRSDPISIRYEMKCRNCGGKLVLKVTDNKVAYGTLHGGISAFLVECLGSLGAYVASGFQQVAGVELSINHLRPAPIGSEVEVVAKPIHIGRRLHFVGTTLHGMPFKAIGEEHLISPYVGSFLGKSLHLVFRPLSKLRKDDIFGVEFQSLPTL